MNETVFRTVITHVVTCGNVGVVGSTRINMDVNALFYHQYSGETQSPNPIRLQAL